MLSWPERRIVGVQVPRKPVTISRYEACCLRMSSPANLAPHAEELVQGLLNASEGLGAGST